MSTEASQPEPFVTVEEAAAHMGLKVGTVYTKVSKGELPYYKIGAALRFKLSELDAAAVRVGPVQP